MASVSSLDQDMRNLRLSRYTPQAANQVRTWIETTLGSSLPPGDLLEVLKDGVALCKLANLLLRPSHGGIKFKASSMPFIQMENISHFLKACEMPPLNMPAHDRFLTVDLYESKDPAQVLQCLGAFSRMANSLKPDVFQTTIGGKKAGAGGAMSPTTTGGANGASGTWRQSSNASTSSYGGRTSPTKASAAMPGTGARAMSPALTGGSTGSQKTDGGSKGPVSSWSRKTDEGNTAPAWNIHQYGYMGGASQGNQGISFGARRQITSQAPSVPSLAEKEKARKEKAAEEERLRQQAEEAEHRRRVEREAEEEQARIEEQQRWEDETRRTRDEERRRMEEQKRQWEEQERRWKEEEEARRKEAAEFSRKLPPPKPRVPSSGILRGQTLSQYQKEQTSNGSEAAETPEQKRVRELEQQLEEARERERQYQAEREERVRQGSDRGSRPTTARTETPTESSWAGDEREYLRQQWQSNQNDSAAKSATESGAQQTRPLPTPEPPTRSLPQQSPPPDEQDDALPLPQRLKPSESASSLPHNLPPSTSTSSIPQVDPDSAINSSPLGSSNRPLPTPDKEFQPYTPSPLQPNKSRTANFLSSNPAPSPTPPRVSSTLETGSTALDQSSLRDSRLASQSTTKAGGWASKSLLEREMERERERQREWEAAQAEVKAAPRDESQGVKPGESWDVNQYGFTGGDGQNRGSSSGSGIDFGGRRQILGPRALPKR
ncbi:calponin [Saxophila tyrrhenica]|uniref:Calponin n=1 Tax=Saxophila tyrrhenica TaxID=1690608 RepID=A0AAV9P1G3_9PEZI|nr:calponin [Saxophila tyrrhenica]